MAAVTYPDCFTVGDSRPKIGLKTKIPDPLTNGYTFDLLLDRPDGTCVVVPGVNLSSDNRGGAYSFDWIDGNKSLVNLEVVLDPGAPLPIGSLVANGSGEQFQTTAFVQNLGAFQGTFAVPAESLLEIAADVSAGAITTIVNPVTGWVSVNNPAAGVAGNPPSLVEGKMQCARIRITHPDGGTQHRKPFYINVDERPCP